MHFKRFIFCGFVLFLTACGSTGNSVIPGMASGGRAIDPPQQLNEATLTDQNGNPFNLNSLKGKTSLVYFGYTNCPDACPITLSNFTRIKQVLANDKDKAAFVFISVDPVRDTPEILKKYLKNFDPDFIGLTADNATLQAVADNFGAIFSNSDEEAAKGIIGHSTAAFLVDAEGKVRVSYPVQALPDPIGAEVKEYIEGRQ
jgi:protein SCO1/2